MGLILPRNPLVYPGNPGFNPAHLAAGPSVRYSGVARGNSFVNLLTGKGATVNGTITPVIDGRIGPAVNNVSSSAFLSTPGVNETPHAVTFGAIFTPTAAVSSFSMLFLNNGAGGTGAATWFLIDSSLTNGISLFIGGAFNDSGLGLTIGVPYFVAASHNGSTVTFVTANLITGAIATISSPSVATIGTPTAGQYFIAGQSSFQLNGNLAAVMYSVNNFLSAPQIRRWAQAPWDFWYPPTVRQTIFSSLKKATTVNSLSFALTDAIEAASFTLTEADKLSLALTDAVETAAFSLTEADKFHFALTDAVETAAFSLSKVKSLSFALTDAVEAASFTLTQTDNLHFALTDPVETASFHLSKVQSLSFALTDAVETATFHLAEAKALHFALTDAVETAHFSLTDNPPVPQPGPQIAFPLRERTYRRRFLGFGYDPKFVITKDRPGPIRIIEFIGEMKDE